MKLKFREKIEEKINNFLKEGEAKTLKFPPMDKYQRKGILHGQLKNLKSAFFEAFKAQIQNDRYFLYFIYYCFKKKFPCGKKCRSIIHDVAEVAGLVSFSFGEEDVDRYIQVHLKGTV